MTLPHEEFNSVKNTRQFLAQLLLKKPLAPKWVRDQARCLLKHFPWTFNGESILSFDELWITYEPKKPKKVLKKAKKRK